MYTGFKLSLRPQGGIMDFEPQGGKGEEAIRSAAGNFFREGDF